MLYIINYLHVNMRGAALAMFAGGLAFWLSATLYAGNGIKERTVAKELATGINLHTIRETILALQALGTRSSFDGQAATSRYLQDALLAIGLKPEVQRYEHAGNIWENVIVTFRGQTMPDQSILAVAHYDSITKTDSLRSPGADDNASGVAVLLELARILPRKPLFSTVQLVFFSNEEVKRAGSKAFARQARANKQNILAVINIDGVGYTPQSKGFLAEASDLLTGSYASLQKGKMLARLVGSQIMKSLQRDTLLKIVTRKQGRYLINEYADVNSCPQRTDCLINKDT